jgi:DNA-binding MarR family transcriptional regulator
MCNQSNEKNLLTNCRKKLQALLFCTQGKMAQKLSGGMPLDQVLKILESLGGQLQTPPHFPMRLVMELADKLEISVPQARRLLNFLEKENLIRYSFTFEAEDENQNKTDLKIIPSPDLSAAFS